MKLVTRTSAAVVIAALGIGALAPVAIAHDWGRQAGPGFGQRHQMMAERGNQDGPRFGAMQGRHGMQGERGGMRGGILNLACSADGAARLEQMFANLSERAQLTDEQTPLFDALKTAALTAQTGFADTCTGLLPEAGTAAAPNMVERLQTRVKIDEARVAALTGVLPSLEAFYDSLTDEQKALLDAGPGSQRGNFGKRQGGPGHFRHGQMMGQNG